MTTPLDQHWPPQPMLRAALIVGAVDNVLRPRLVGKGTRMHELTSRSGSGS